MPHTGEYRTLGLTEAEARCIDLTLHADMFKPALHVTTDQVFDAYLKAIKYKAVRLGRLQNFCSNITVHDTP